MSSAHIDRYLPAFDVASRHSVLVDAPPGRVYAATRELDLARSPTIRALFALRGLPLLVSSGRLPAAGRLMLDDLVRAGFVVLAEDPGVEILLGVAGRFWTPTGGLVPVDPSRFATFERPGVARAVWNFRVTPAGGGRTELATETRVRCPGRATRRRFLRYWRVVGPFSGLVRRRALALVKSGAESR